MKIRLTPEGRRLARQREPDGTPTWQRRCREADERGDPQKVGDAMILMAILNADSDADRQAIMDWARERDARLGIQRGPRPS